MKICNYKAIDNIPRNSGCTLSSIEIDQKKRATVMGGLTNTLMLQVSARVMLTVNVDIDGRLINGQIKKVLVIRKPGDNLTKL